MYSELKWSYTDLAEEFEHLVPNWDDLEGYVTDAIIRDALNRGNEFWRFWDNDPKFTENGRITAIRAFVLNYIEVVENMMYVVYLFKPTSRDIWTMWGTTLRLLEVSR